MSYDDGVLQDIKISQQEAQVHSDVAHALHSWTDIGKTSIKEIAAGVNLGPEAWIQQAKKLQADIEASKNTARNIVKQAQYAETLRARQTDIAGKGDLLRSEVAFNFRLQSVLEQVRRLQLELASAQEATKKGRLGEAFEKLQKLEKGLENLRAIDRTTAAQLLHERVHRLRATIEDDVRRLFAEILEIDPEQNSLTIHEDVQQGHDNIPFDLKAITTLCSKLNSLDANASAFSCRLEAVIVNPLLPDGHQEARSRRVSAEHKALSLCPSDTAPSSENTVEDLITILSFLKRRLPPELCEMLSDHLVPSLVQRLLSQYLPKIVDSSIDNTDAFESMLQSVSSFADHLTNTGWVGTSDVQEWIESAPRVWISKRRETALARVKTILEYYIHQTHEAERVETQMISNQELAGGPNGAADDDDWNVDWTEQEPQSSQDATSSHEGEHNDDDEDASAWEIDEESSTPGVNNKSSNGSAIQGHQTDSQEEEDTDAWEWNDDTGSTASSPVNARKPRDAAPSYTPQTPKGKQTDQAQEVTLRETYTTTGVPSALYDLITQTCNDAETLQMPPLSTSSIAPAASALRSVPALVLAGYRALSPTYYQPLPGSNMYLYNDPMRLSELLNGFQTTHKPGNSSMTIVDLASDTAALESFARRAYGKEMDSQRTILRDLLGLAQGFSNCTEQPFAGACDDAVSAVVDHITGLHKQWKSILSPSALLQSLGNLLQTITQKMIVDIEDLSDIGEDESTRLKHFCDEVSKLSSFFLQQSPTDPNAGVEGRQDTTPLYVPNWFKFQHLSEILESNLADIRYLWNEGDLRMDFEKEELIELVQALFADNGLRKTAISEIRRG